MTRRSEGRAFLFYGDHANRVRDYGAKLNETTEMAEQSGMGGEEEEIPRNGKQTPY